MTGFHRWLRFNAVGVLGMAVQLSALALFNRVLHGHYLWATALALELTLLHNFAWHERVTWHDRTTERRMNHLLRFHLSNGLTSLIGNLVLMRLFIHVAHMRLLAANLICILICSVANFLLSHYWAFAATQHPSEESPNGAMRLAIFIGFVALLGMPSVIAQEPDASTSPSTQSLPAAPTPNPPHHEWSRNDIARMGWICGSGASTSSAGTKPTFGCGVGVTILPLPVFFEVGVMGPQANRSYLSGYISVDGDVPLAHLGRKYVPMGIVGYTRMFETGHALDLGVALATPRWRKPVGSDKSMRIELRDYWTFANPSQHNVMLRIGWMGDVAD